VQFRFRFPLSSHVRFLRPTGLKAILKLAPFLPVRHRVRLFFHIEARALEEIRQYIDHHTKIAGKPTSLFADGAKIFRHTEGIVRQVNFILFPLDSQCGDERNPSC
jgi:hypothetical protein